MDRDKSLTRKEFEAVMRRATELALGDSEPGELTEADVYRIAREVGVPDRHIRLALAEVRAGETGATAIDRFFGPETVHASRVVPGTARDLSQRIDHFLVAGRLLQPVRRTPAILQYRPAVDWMSKVARAASATSRRYFVASAKSVEARLEEVEAGRTIVEFDVDPGTRGEVLSGALFGGGVAGAFSGVGAGFGVALLTGSLVLSVASGVAIGGALMGGIAVAVAKSNQKKMRAVHAEVEGILDQLESGEELEPPPPSWSDWVKRQFHGARKLMDELEVERGKKKDPGRRI
jgi:hypothetical protein